MVNIDKDIISRTFDLLGEEYGAPVNPHVEITASMLYRSDPSVTQRTHLNRLKRLVEMGLYTSRVAKQGELAFKPVNDE